MRRSTRLVTLTALGVCWCLLLLVATSRADDTTPAEPTDSGSRHSGGILSMIMSPFRATMDSARRLFGRQLSDASDMVTDGFSAIQVQTFRVFMSLYNKTYSPEEIPRRMALFFERRQFIEQSVIDFAEGRLPFMMRENTFLDWDEDELKALTGVSPPQSSEEMTEEERKATTELDDQAMPPGDLELDNEPGNSTNTTSGAEVQDLTVHAIERIPAAKDWRASGCVSTPINQMKCGACYAIATMGALESIRCIRRVSSPILSPQQVVDCATERVGYKNYGCDGGWPTRVLTYLSDVGVAARESCYPFVRRQTRCHLSGVRAVPGCIVSASPSNSELRYKVLSNERDIQYHVAKTGPVITVMRTTDRFLYYSSGIFDDPKCSRRRDDVDHAVVIVGYGRENGQDYWLIKNSWGISDWGEAGYAKFKRGTNACSIGHWGWVITG